MRQLKLASVLLALLVLVACPNNPKTETLPPGARNQFYATSYTSLMGAQAVLNSVKADVKRLPPEAKPAHNKAIAYYDVAEAAWQAFHAGKSNDQAAPDNGNSTGNWRRRRVADADLWRQLMNLQQSLALVSVVGPASRPPGKLTL